MDNIYVVRGSEQAGPFTEADIRAQLASGALTGDSLVWWEGQPEWAALSKTPLASLATPAPRPTPSGAIPAPGAPAPITSAPVSEFTPPEAALGAPKTNGLALASLITGVVSIPTAFCYGLGLLVGIAAIITGHMARGQLAKNPAEGGKGLALAGLICGYVSVGLTLLSVVAVCVLIALGNQVKTVFSTINSQLNNSAVTNSAPATPGQ